MCRSVGVLSVGHLKTRFWASRAQTVKICDFSASRLERSLGRNTAQARPPPTPSTDILSPFITYYERLSHRASCIVQRTGGEKCVGPIYETAWYQAVGTLGWISPEEMLGESVTEKSDIYSFGMVRITFLILGHHDVKCTIVDTSTGTPVFPFPWRSSTSPVTTRRVRKLSHAALAPACRFCGSSLQARHRSGNGCRVAQPHPITPPALATGAAPRSYAVIAA